MTREARSTRPRLARDGGYVLALGALLIIPMTAFVAFAVDLGAWQARASEVRNAAHAAALAGVTRMPTESAAITEARAVAARNGFVHSPTGPVQVLVNPLGSAQLQVTIIDGDVDQYFSSLFVDDVTIERSATAEFIEPVPMGSPRNFIGTNALANPGLSDPENFWLSASGYCARREHGDRITPRTDANEGSSGFEGCTPQGAPPSTSALGDNPEWRDWGYLYAIEFEDKYTGDVAIEVFNPGHCDGEASNPSSDSGASTSAARDYEYTILDRDNPLDPVNSKVIWGPTTFSPSDCSSNNRWTTLDTLSAPAGGIYYLQINPVEPIDKDLAEGQNQFSIRARDTSHPASGTGWPCTIDAAEATTDAPHRTDCPQVYALTHLGVYLRNLPTNSTADFYLASIDSAHAGRRVEIELFDAAEETGGIELLDPEDNAVTFEWEVACQDGSYRSENGGNCATLTGENAPPGGYGPTIASFIDTSGSGIPDSERPWGSRNSQSTTYSDRIIRLAFTLPTDASDWYGGNSWFQLRYHPAGATGDRTTWTVRIIGDPVRLVENPAP